MLRVSTYERRLGASRPSQGRFHLLILVGAGGLAKSRSVRAALGGEGCWIEGDAASFGMYARLRRRKDECVVVYPVI